MGLQINPSLIFSITNKKKTERWEDKIRMNSYAIIDIGGKQLRVEQGRFHDARHFGPVRPASTSDTKISINRVLLIRHGSNINFGYPWLNDAAVKGRILHGCFNKKLVIRKIYSRKKT